MALHCIKYQSALNAALSENELQALLAKARHYNAAHHISGLLLCRNEQVVQVLEGEEEALRVLYAKIQHDPRHHSLEVLADEPLSKRSFGAWAMALRR